MGKGYDQIKKIADRLGWPTSFRRDLEYHDKRALEDYDGSFLWSVRESGTHLQRRDTLCAEAQQTRNGWRHFGSAWREIAGGRMSSEERTFVCAPGGCREITGKPDEALRIMREWLEDCKAPSWRINEVLAGQHRRRRQRRR